MRLTVAELALAVNKSETYVRQHIHRRHLTVLRDGRNVSVARDEAERWARERGLSFVMPGPALAAEGSVKGRCARMTILALQSNDAPSINLFTHIRHRRQDALGPWAREPDETWSTNARPINNGGKAAELRVYTMDAPFVHCQEMVEHILNEGTLEINGLDVHYVLEPNPRRHWAFRDQRPDTDCSVTSPFSRHSAEVFEYWSFAREPRERWLGITRSLAIDLQPLLARLSFPLDRRQDRVGNLMISGAKDAIDCEITATSNNALVFSVNGNELPSGAFTATVWAGHSGDNLVRKNVAVEQPQNVIDIQSEVDHMGFAIYRNVDGQCIDLMEVYLIKSVSIGLSIERGPTLQIRDRKGSTTNVLNPWSSRSTIDIEFDEASILRDKEIRREVVDRKIYEREATARKEGNLARFSPDQFDEAVEYFLVLMRQHSYSNDPIYLADPYFLTLGSGEKERSLYFGILNATAGRPLRILCGQLPKAPPWWSTYPSVVTSHVTVRAFTAQNDKPAFHDRYLITRDREILISHSLNGWHTGGVTFASLPYGVYRAEAVQLWSLDTEATDKDVRVWEVD